MKWIPRESNSEADRLSRIIDFDDYTLTDEVFLDLDFKWRPHTVDKFACAYNAKLVRFNSRFYQPCTKAVDALTQNWEFEKNRLHPPFCQVANVISHLRACKAS